VTRELGTAKVNLHVLVGSMVSAKRLRDNFALRSRAIGTVTDYHVTITKRGQHDILVVIQYRHTCHNHHNTNSDARRFVTNAIKGTTFRIETQVTRANWKQVLSA
jgi:hypothetical protein